MARKKFKFSWVYEEKNKEKRKNSQFLMWKQTPLSPPPPPHFKLEPVVFFFSPPQFCDVAQVVIIHKYIASNLMIFTIWK